MKKLLPLLLFPVSVYASPFLACNSVPATDPTAPILSYTIQGLPAVNLSVPATVNTDGSFQLHYDLGPLANGSYTVTAVAVNQWGASAASSPFLFSKVLPGAPAGLKLAPN